MEATTLNKITFFIEMPEAIAVPHHSEFTFWLPELVSELDNVELTISPHSQPICFPEGRLFVCIRFWQFKAPLRLPFTDALWAVLEEVTSTAKPEEDGELVVDGFRTVIEATTLLLNGDDQKAVSTAFDYCFDRIREFCRSFATSTNQPISPVTLQRLPLGIPYTVASLFEPLTGVTGWFLLHPYFPDLQPRDPLEKEELNRLNAVLFRQSRKDPFTLAQEQIGEARRLMYRTGDFGDAVIHSHLAAEIFLDGVLLYMLWEEGTSHVDAASYFESGFSTRLKRDFGPRLGGNWGAESNVVTSLRSDLMRLRGRVVHGGYRPSADEAQVALDTYPKLVDFIKSRLAARRLKYPRTALMVLGIPGMTRLGLWNGKIKRYFDEGKGGVDWGASFREWCDAVRAIRE